MRPHHFIPLFKTGRMYCWRCGLIVLKNKASEKAVRKSCYEEEV